MMHLPTFGAIHTSRRLTECDRERVNVARIGLGTTVDCVLCQGTIIGYGVQFDHGEYLTVTPDQLRPMTQIVPDTLHGGNVIRFPRLPT